ncbi:GNAT family N-acetyltransferase [Abyssibacter sp.]|uniref:GNAT family N-acetyltransferase n=1 Tax=Abyssibacter sp. TaxID=2320200 RepID=UPI000C62A9E7|nr:GNAT family N-acetyltransferase [Abyssibacter sp.]MBB85736.1 phosphinothricin acetyltransferase [Xanthomonadales bacterium]MCK5859422.1 N-acetyltransferase [Abyssibacter sp.]
MSECQLRDATSRDAPSIAAIYNPFITDTVVTFEEQTVSADQMEERLTRLQEQGLPWRVIERDGRVLGYAYAGLWRARAAYRFVAESAIYLSEAARGQGLGTTLYQDLFEQLRARGMRMVMGVIALPHPASVAFHERLGFERQGVFPQVGYKFDRWIDVGYWQLDLTR